MAATQYQVFCRYLNETVNHVLTNQTSVDWIGAEEVEDLTKFYTENKTQYNTIQQQLLSGTIRENQLSVQQLNMYNKCKQYEELQDKIQKDKIAIERCILEPFDSLYDDEDNSMRKAQAARVLELQQYVIDETKATNPKYDMVFMYDGLGYVESRTGQADYNPPEDDNKQVPYAYYDRMKRIEIDPWFLFSTHASLISAMAKAKELVNILGKDAVKIGKIVPLEQYIEII